MKKLLILILSLMLTSCATIIFPSDNVSINSSKNNNTSTENIQYELSKKMERQIIFDYCNQFLIYDTCDAIGCPQPPSLSDLLDQIKIEQFYGAYNDFYIIRMNNSQTYFYECYEIIGDTLFLFPNKINIIVYHKGDFLNFNEVYLSQSIIQEHILAIHQIHLDTEPLNRQFTKQMADEIKNAYMKNYYITNVYISDLYDIVDNAYLLRLMDEYIYELCIDPIWQPFSYYILDDVILYDYYNYFNPYIVYKDGEFYDLESARNNELITRETLLKIGTDVYETIKLDYYKSQGSPTHYAVEDIQLSNIWNSPHGQYAVFISFNNDADSLIWYEFFGSIGIVYNSSVRIMLWSSGYFYTLTEAYELSILTNSHILEIAMNYNNYYYGFQI